MKLSGLANNLHGFGSASLGGAAGAKGRGESRGGVDKFVLRQAGW